MFASLMKSARPLALLSICVLAASTATAPASPASAATRGVASPAASVVRRLLNPALLLDSNGRPLAAYAHPRTAALGKRANSAAYTFQTIDDPTKPTGTNLYGINNNGTIVGFFGQQSTTDPDVGIKISPPYDPQHFKLEEFNGGEFGSNAQTALTGINNNDELTGAWITSPDQALFGLAKSNGVFTTYVDPNTDAPSGQQIYGVLYRENDNGIAVGSYSAGNILHAFAVNRRTGQ